MFSTQNVITLIATTSLVSPIVSLSTPWSFRDKVARAQTPVTQTVQSLQWEKFTSENGNFSVMMPGTPRAEIEQQEVGEFGEFFLEIDGGSA